MCNIIKNNNPQIANILTIAGSDSGGGAGIQADIKAISATKSYACSVITALTAQNTKGVLAIEPVNPNFISAQLTAIFEDINIDAIKIGMIANVDVVQVVSASLRKYQAKNIVLDPVMVTTSGDQLIDFKTIDSLKKILFPMVSLITPNVFEAILLTGEDPTKDYSVDQLISKIQQDSLLKNQAVLLKGGHLKTKNSDDFLIQGDHVHVFSSPRIKTGNTHGTGCTLSSAIASYWGQGYSLVDSIEYAKSYLSGAILASGQLNAGQGAGPVHHFYQNQSGN